MMNKFTVSKLIFSGILSCFLVMPAIAPARTGIDAIVIFGTSLSDSGNAFALLSEPSFGLKLTKPQHTPPYDVLDEPGIPAPYAKGGHHFSDGATWIEQLARARGLAAWAHAAFRGNGSKAANYAVGGARAAAFPERVNLKEQLDAYFFDFPQPPGNALFVIEMGSNDVRDALVALATGGDPGAVIEAALDGIADAIIGLHQAGAQAFLVLNVPDIGLTPAVRALGPAAVNAAGMLTDGFNFGLAQLLADLRLLLGVEITEFDIHEIANRIHDFPEDYGLLNLDQPCLTPNIPPFHCPKPDEFFFWDGIHPTGAVHAVFGHEAGAIVH